MSLLQSRKLDESGFTLVELLTVVAIIGILAAFASLQYPAYKARSFDARAQSDLKNLISAQEAVFADKESFASSLADLVGFSTASPGVLVVVELDASSDGTTWSGSTYHPNGTNTYCFDSSTATGIILVEGLDSECPTS